MNRNICQHINFGKFDSEKLELSLFVIKLSLEYKISFSDKLWLT